MTIVARSGHLALQSNGYVAILSGNARIGLFCDHITEIEPSGHPWYRTDLVLLQQTWSLHTSSLTERILSQT